MAHTCELNDWTYSFRFFFANQAHFFIWRAKFSEIFLASMPPLNQSANGACRMGYGPFRSIGQLKRDIPQSDTYSTTPQVEKLEHSRGNKLTLPSTNPHYFCFAVLLRDANSFESCGY